MNTHNPGFGDWSAFAGNSDCPHLRGGGEPLLARADREHLSHKKESRVRLVGAHEATLRGFKTDDITHRAMTCFATNTPFMPAGAVPVSAYAPTYEGFMELVDE